MTKVAEYFEMSQNIDARDELIKELRKLIHGMFYKLRFAIIAMDK